MVAVTLCYIGQIAYHGDMNSNNVQLRNEYSDLFILVIATNIVIKVRCIRWRYDQIIG